MGCKMYIPGYDHNAHDLDSQEVFYKPIVCSVLDDGGADIHAINI